MPKDKTQFTSSADITGTSGLSAKSITGVAVHRHGAVIVVEINYTGGPTYVKIKQNVAEVGGTLDFGTGTAISL